MDDFAWIQKEIDLVSTRMGSELAREEIISLARAAQGLSAKQEAAELDLPVAEVQQRRRRLLAKIGSRSMTEAVARLKGGAAADIRLAKPGPRSRLSQLAERALT